MPGEAEPRCVGSTPPSCDASFPSSVPAAVPSSRRRPAFSAPPTASPPSAASPSSTAFASPPDRTPPWSRRRKGQRCAWNGPLSRAPGRGGGGRLVEATLPRVGRGPLAVPAGHHVSRRRTGRVLSAPLPAVLGAHHGILWVPC